MSAATPAGAVSIAFQPETSTVDAYLENLRKGVDVPLRAKWIGPSGEPTPPASAQVSTPAPTTFSSARDNYVGPSGTGSFTGPAGLAFTAGQGFSVEPESPEDRAATKTIGPIPPKVEPSRAVLDLGSALTVAEQKARSMKEAAAGPIDVAGVNESSSHEGVSLASSVGAVPPALTAAADRMLRAAEQMERAAGLQERSSQRRESSYTPEQREQQVVSARLQRRAARDLGISSAEATALGIPESEKEEEEGAEPIARPRGRGGMPFMLPRGPRSIFAQGGRALSRRFGGAGAFAAAYVGYEAYQGANELVTEYNQRRVAQLTGQNIFQQAGRIREEASDLRGGNLVNFGITRSMEFISDQLGSAGVNAPEFLTRARSAESYYASIERAGGERDFLHASRREEVLRNRAIREAGEVNPFARERLNIQTQAVEATQGISERYNAELLKYNDVNDPQQRMRDELEKERAEALKRNDDLYQARLRGQQRDESAQYRAQAYTSRGQTIANAARLRGDVQGALSAEAFGAYQSFRATEAQRYDLTTPEGSRARDTALENLASNYNTQGQLARQSEQSQRISMAGESESLGFAIARRPLQAQIAAIQSQTQAAINEEHRPEFVQRIFEEGEQRKQLAAQEYNDRQQMQLFSLRSQTERFNIEAGLTPQSQGQTLPTRRVLEEIQDITSGTEAERRLLVIEGAPDDLLHANAQRGRAQLAAFRSRLTESQRGTEIDPFAQSATGIGTLDIGSIQKRIAAAFKDVSREDRNPGDNASISNSGGAGANVGQNVQQIQQVLAQSLQVQQQLYDLWRGLGPVVSA